MPSFLRDPLIVTQGISPELSQEILNIGRHMDTSYAAIGGSHGVEDYSTRKSGVSWLPKDMTVADGKTRLNEDLIQPMVYDINDKHFGFDLTYHENNQFTTYKAPDEHYQWHCDGGPDTYQLENSKEDTELITQVDEQVNTYRKLSYIIQLSHPDDYDGGRLEWIDPCNNHSEKDWGLFIETVPQSGKEQGTLIVFSSILYHRVTPVTRGIRHSLVGWICGPRFK